MTGTAPERTVYRYFDLADCFVQIAALEQGSLTLADRPGLGRAGYRKLVIQACMPDFRESLDATLERLFPDDPLMVEDLLYQLCVEVNPGLDIHEVRLEVDPGAGSDAAPSGSPATADGGAADRDALLERLGQRSAGLEARLRQRVIGQDRAVRAVARAVRSAAAGLGEAGRPLGSFLLTGRTGTGKTELARVLADDLFGADGLVRIDCSEFAMAHESSKLIGAPPGYVGHDDGGQLTDAVAQTPECVVLFDEVEKAHPKLHNLMLQILEDGNLTDGKGKTVDFSRALVLMTSNCGAEDVQSASRAVGFGGTTTLGRASLEDITGEALARAFPPEFLGRIGETVLFDELGVETVEAIAAKKLRELSARARTRGYAVRITPAVARWVARRGFRPESGARELRRVIQAEIEPRLSELLLERGAATVRVRGGDVVFA